MNVSTIARLCVAVIGWSNLRTVVVEEARVLMEVARTSGNCHHCQTCRRRVATVEAEIGKKPLVWKWEFLPEGGMWLAISRQPNTDPLELLRQATGLRITAA